MGFLATLSHPSSKAIEKSEYDQATLEFAMAYDSRELVDGTEAEYGQVTSEFAPSCDYRELVDGTEVEFDQVISDLYKKTEDQCNQIGAIIKTEAEYGRMTSEFAPSRPSPS